MIDRKSKIFIAGHNGMVGSAIKQCLEKDEYSNIITAERSELDLTEQTSVRDYIFYNKPEVVIDCAAKVGGIHANNTYRADFIYSNLQIQNNLIHYSHLYGVKKFLFLGSSCIYPKFADQPIKEEYLLTSPLEYTNEAYSIAKIAGIKMCENYYKQHGCNFLSVMPTNLYGPGDNFHPDNSHVLPALIRKFHEAYVYNYKEVEIWGTGKAKREFLHVNDLAEACKFVLEKVQAQDIYSQNISHLNIGSGTDVLISKLAEEIAKVTKFDGKIKFQLDKPDGTLRKLMDNSRIKKLGWKPKISLEEGLKITHNWYKDNEKNARSF
ncbi:GDP-fucose synthetase [archaeon]|nr:GDP-fucose synthetase [archaeon]|tara:strand:+ start:97 stop:1065 length:969 start_codon:yes stop_codon:yes gene_type:complete